MSIPLSGIMSKAEFIKWWYANHYLASHLDNSLTDADWHKYHITLLDMAYACYRQGIVDYRESTYKLLLSNER